MKAQSVALGVAFTLVLPAAPALAGAPTEELKHHVDEVIGILEEPPLEGNVGKRRAEIRRVSESIFDYQETARRALGRHWASRTPQEQAEFVRLFADLLDHAYLSRIEQYQGETVRYRDESIEGSEAIVNTSIMTPRGAEVPVDYRMRLANGRWRVYDVHVEGVSLVGSYRTQFNRIVQTESYQGLLQRLRERGATSAASSR